MKKIVLLMSLVILLSSCWNKSKDITVEPIITTWAIEEEITPDENRVVTWGTDEASNLEEDVIETDKPTEEAKEEETSTQPKVVEEKKVEVTTPVVKTKAVKEETTPIKVVDHEETTPVADEGTDELIDDMIGDIDDIFKEIESEG